MCEKSHCIIYDEGSLSQAPTPSMVGHRWDFKFIYEPVKEKVKRESEEFLWWVIEVRVWEICPFLVWWKVIRSREQDFWNSGSTTSTQPPKHSQWKYAYIQRIYLRFKWKIVPMLRCLYKVCTMSQRLASLFLVLRKWNEVEHTFSA